MEREEINNIAQEVDILILKELYKKIKKNHIVNILTKASEQTLLVPVKDPISNGSFYAGEVLVTSSIVEVDNTKGWSMVMDSNEDLSLYIAVIDAAFEANIFKDEIITLLKKTKKQKEESAKKENQRVNSTRVSFDLM